MAERNLEENQGTLSRNSTPSFSNKQISENLTNIGISLEKELNVVQSSVMLIKEVEKGRTKIPVAKIGEYSLVD